MNLSKFTDYSFRALIFLAKNSDKLYTVEDLSKNLNTSENHMKKVIHNLAKKGYITSIKGRNGGLKLSESPDNIKLIDIINITENLSDFVHCFNLSKDCIYESNCKLKSIFSLALDNFLLVFNNYTLKDIL